MTVPTPAQWAKQIALAQQQTTVHLCGVPYRRIAYGQEVENAAPKCRDCGVAHGQLHVPTCCIERCPICTGQAIGCGCADGDPLGHGEAKA